MADEKRTYILYDSRATPDSPEDASVLVVLSNEDGKADEEARSYAGDFGGMVCFSYRDNGKELVDERFEWNWYPNTGFSDREPPRRKKRRKR